MTISALQETGLTTDNAATCDLVFGSNVTVGTVICVGATKYVPAAANDFVAGQLTKQAGTATIGTVSMHINRSIGRDGTSTDVIHAAVFTVLITGAGSLTLRLTDAAGTYWVVGFGEYSSDIGWDSGRLEASGGNATATDGQTSGSSGNLTSAGEALFFGVIDVFDDFNNPITPDAAFTTVYEQEDGTAHGVGNCMRRIVSSGTTDALDWAIPATNLAHAEVGVVLKRAATTTNATATPSGGSGATAAGTPLAIPLPPPPYTLTTVTG